MNRLLLSPVAMGFLPVVIVHMVVLAYFLGQKHKSGQTKLLVGWFFSMGLLCTAQLARSVVGGLLEAYLCWLGFICSAMIGQLLWLQFAYRFPRLIYPREARVILGISIALIIIMLGLFISTVLTCPMKLSYSFEQFAPILSGPCSDRGPLAIERFSEVVPLVVYLWSLIVRLREVVTFSSTACPEGLGPRPWWRLRALWQPCGKEAKAARAFCLVTLTLVGPLVAVFLEPRGILPAGTFSATLLLTLFAIILVYVNNAPESSTFLVKLVGVSLVTLLAVLGVVNLMILEAHQEAYEQARLAELGHIKSLVEVGHVDLAPAQVQYVVSRPAGEGLFPTTYQLIFSRVQGLSAQSFVEQDARLQAGLAQGTLTGQQYVWYEHTWIGPLGVNWSPGEGLEQLAIPEGVRAYRGTFSPPEERYIRYAFVQGDMLYEVGYSHLSYRQGIHRTAVPLAELMIGATLLVVLGFPLFFRASLVRPLQNLLQGVARVDDGDLDVTVPIETEDEIGFLTTAFNRMVRSLRTSEANLRSEIAERQCAEDEARALSVTLEQRVVDRTRDLTVLYEVSAVASQALDLATLLSESLVRMMEAMQVDMGVVCLLEEGQALHVTAQQGVPAELMARIEAVLADRDVVSRLVEHLEPMLLRDILDIAADPAVSLPALVAPMCAGGQVQGILCLIRGSPQEFGEEEIALLASVADQVGVAVQSDRLRAQAQEASVLQERHRLARDLHDSVTQSIHSLVLFTETLDAALDRNRAKRARQLSERLQESARQALKEMRLMLYELQPLSLSEYGSLAQALEARLQAVELRAGVDAHLVKEGDPAWPQDWNTELFWIINEALNNALKHAQASSVWVTLRCNPAKLELTVEDDGIGFDTTRPRAGGMGLHTMAARSEALGGDLVIESSLGQNTRVRFWANIAQNTRQES